MMDLFSGAGGLSTGLESSGVAVAHWAVENCPDAAEAFRLNHPKVKEVRLECCAVRSLLIRGTRSGTD